MQTLVKTPLDGGGLKLSAPRPHAAAAREKARIITMAWGDRYVHDLLALTIPALLAPGNIPAFVEHFDATFTLVTEQRFFDDIAEAPVTKRLLTFCDVRLVPIDDLLSSWYGITLTYALVRGFADLGAEMVGAHLVFLNADFIVADGSYRKLAEAIRRGERLVVSPSYCAVLEDVSDPISRHYDEETCALPIAKRDLAALILVNRHNTIRAKTVNQALFRIHRYDQFYWHVNDDVLLGRQMPISVIYMRPERALTEMPTFWDYGVISEYCPGATPCVLGDSDDFLMAELRTKNTFRELLDLGWPSVNEIAKDLSSFTTHDQRVYGHYTLALHAADLPSTVDADKRKLAEFVETVYGRLGPPVDYVNHRFWAQSFPQFVATRLLRQATIEEERHALDAVLQNPVAADRHKEIFRLRLLLRDAGKALKQVQTKFAPQSRALARRRLENESAYRDHQEKIERELQALCGEESDAEREVAERIDALRRELTGLEEEEKRDVRLRTGHASEQRIKRRVRLDLARLNYAPPGLVSRALQFYRRIFGPLHRTTPWHPYHATLRPAQAALMMAATETAGDVLVIATEGDIGPALVREFPRRATMLTPAMAKPERLAELASTRRDIGVCFICLDERDIVDLGDIVRELSKTWRRSLQIVIFHHCKTVATDLLDSVIGLPPTGQSEIALSGSWPGSVATRLFHRAARNYNVSLYTDLIRLTLTLAICAPFSWLASRIEARRNARMKPGHLTGMLIKIKFD